MSRKTRILTLSLMLSALAVPGAAHACACGCGIFDVGGGSVMPQAGGSGFTAWLGFDHIDQDHNHEGGHAADPADNVDKRIETSFYTLGGEYTISRNWAVTAEMPLYDRHFTTTAQNRITGNNDIADFPLTDLGDMVVNVAWTGLTSTPANGLTFGIKLPTGRYISPTYRNYGQTYDRDTLPGTGSTDIQFGGWHTGHLGGGFGWYAQAQYRIALATRDGYRPGNDLNGALGVTYLIATHSGFGGGGVGGGGIGIEPSLALLGSLRAHDTGASADPFDSGYRRLLIAPGLKLQMTRKLSVYGDVEVPLAEYFNAAASPAANPLGTSGQLVAPVMFKLRVSHGF